MKLNLTAFGAAWLVTTLIVSMGMMGVGVLYAQHKKVQVRRGWNLTPVVVATHSLNPGAVLSPADVAVKEVPEMWLTPSVYKGTELSSVIGHPLLDPIAKDDLLMHWHVEILPPTPQCLERVAAAAADAGVVADPGVKHTLDAMIAEAGSGHFDGR